MPTGVLDTIKTSCGIDSENSDFDQELLIFINSNVSVLCQLGVVSTPIVVDANTTWTDLIGSYTDIEMIKTEMYLAVVLVFDPPVNASVLASYQKHLEELQFRLREQCDPSRMED